MDHQFDPRPADLRPDFDPRSPDPVGDLLSAIAEAPDDASAEWIFLAGIEAFGLQTDDIQSIVDSIEERPIRQELARLLRRVGREVSP